MSDESIRNLTIRVEHGDGAVGSIPDPAAFEDGGLEWCLRYAPQHHNCNLQAAGVVSTFDYLLSGNTTMKEATRRLRQMRAARRERIKSS
jgi:hypothetical protein